MTRLATILTAVLLALGTGACDKPSSDDCEKALRNMQQILGTDTFNKDPASLQSEVLIGQENVGKALALGMVIVVAVVMTLYALLQRRTARWLR